MLQNKEKLEIIIPIYNEESCLDELFRRLLFLREKLGYLDMDFIFINDGSKDRSLTILHNYAERHNFIKVINFSRNFGHQIAVTAGLDYADADYIVIMDADLQDPPELIEDMYRKAKEGFDIVYGKRLTRKGETIFKKVTAKIFYGFINKMCDIEIPTDAGDFRLISKTVLKTLKQMREKHRFVRGMVPWTGFSSTPQLYNRDERYAGKTKYPFKKMVKFALDAIFSFSNVPLRVATYFGLMIVSLGFLGSLLLLYYRFFTSIYVSGITAVILTIIIMSGFQIIFLGLIGEYIGRIFEESKNRPLYVIKNFKNLP
ncbi:MAG: glycosyltransferase family 2 protein [Nitrospirae bacterium]|nr:glycosyltransferase family 2 protein [Nitrospirota bacterium]